MNSHDYHPIAGDPSTTTTTSLETSQPRPLRQWLPAVLSVTLLCLLVNLLPATTKRRSNLSAANEASSSSFQLQASFLERSISEDYMRRDGPPAILYISIREITGKCDEGLLCMAFVAIVKTNLSDVFTVKTGYKIIQSGTDELAFCAVPQSTRDRVSNTTVGEARETLISLIHAFDKYKSIVRCEFNLPLMVLQFMKAANAEQACTNTISRICYLNLDSGTC